MKQYWLTLITLFISVLSLAQNSDPYAIFGHTSNVTYKTSVTEMLYIKNSDTNSSIKAIVFDMENSKVNLLGVNDILLKEMFFEKTQLLRWLSTDPLANKYPGHSPYNFCINNPIKFIDPDGREVKNAMQENLDNAKKEQSTAQANVNGLSSSASKREVKNANKALTRANKNLQNAQSLYDKVQNAITLMQTVDQNYFNKINTLKDAGGNEVNIYVTASNANGSVYDNKTGTWTTRKGNTTLNFYQNQDGTPHTDEGLNGSPYVKFYADDHNTVSGFTITLYSTATQGTIANEFGNVEFSTENSVLDATEAVMGVPYAQRQGEIYSKQVQINFEAKLKLINANQIIGK